MPYGIIVLIASVALVAYFDFATKASWIAKAAVSVIFVICFGTVLGWIAGINYLVALYLLIALSIFVLFYRTVQQARSGK